MMIQDQLQRDQALDPTQSFIVQAPAGSGKTELLTQRFLRLLSCVHEPEEILAITFTKKAASEMRSRIRDALQKAQHQPLPTTPHEQKTWQLAKNALIQDQKQQWGLLDNPNRLRIKTIDAFNTLLTRQLPLLSHFGAIPEIIDYPQLIYRLAVKNFLLHLEENADWSNAIGQLLLHLDNNMQATEDLLIEMLSKRDQWLPYIVTHAQHPSLRKMLEDNLCAVITEALSKLHACFPEDCASELIDILQFSISHLKANVPSHPILACEQLTALPGVSPEDKAAWLGIAELLLTKEDDWRKSLNINLGFPPKESRFKQRLKELIQHLSEDEDLRLALSALRYLPHSSYSESQWEILKVLHIALQVAVAQLQVLFKQSGKIDYTENAQAALLALGNDEAPTDLALALDYQIKHILVDEFQDTSNNQFRLLEKLVTGWQPEDGRTLFLVGDPMQSIYRFREAEVGLFIRARLQGIAGVQLEPLTLSVNFRSIPPLVEWINTHFNRVMPAMDDIASGAVSFTPCNASSKHADAIDAIAVHLHAFIEDQQQTQAQAIIEIIQQALQSTEDNIAILVRSRKHLKHIIPLLKKAEIPYQAVEIDNLEARPVIQDLLALTRALFYPADRTAWLSILRSPWCGLTLSDLLSLSGGERHALIWQRMQQPETIALLSADGQQRIARIITVLHTTMEERYREAIHLWIEKTWIALGGPACVENASDLQDAKIFFSLVKKLSQSENGLRWESLKESLKKLYAQSNTQTAGRIQIMTIHNAKGLEFDTVILPHLEKGTHNSDKPLLTWLERPLRNNTTALLLAPIHAVGDEDDATYTHIRHQDMSKTRHENGRLLYVAATRAKKALHLLMNLKMNTAGEVSSLQDSSMLKKLWPTIEDKIQFAAEKSAVILPNTATPRFIKRLSLDWKNPLPLPVNAARPLHNRIEGFHLSQTDAQAVGVVVHHLLQYISHFGLSWWEKASLQQRQDYIHGQLIRQGVLASLSTQPAEKVLLAIENTLADPKGLWIIQQQQEALAEFALSAVIYNQTKLFVMDKTFVDENNIRWIIDYKTSAPHHQDVELFLEQERQTYAKQMQQYQQAMQLLDKRPIRLGLYFPLVPAWCEVYS